MKKIILFSFFAFMIIYVKAQPYYMNTNSGQTISTCIADFYDNASGNYAANVNQIITFQSNSSTNTHLRVSFATFNIDPSDTLYVYDGLTITAPLIGKYNNSHPLSAGQNGVQSTITNLSGALTFKFVTNGSNQKDGWFASVNCIKACQRIIASIDTILTSPKPDSNYIDLCLGDTITFVAGENFPDNNIAYHQSIATCTYEWDFGDGTPNATGSTVTHNYITRRGYDIMLTVTDSTGCVNTNAIGTRVRISSKPTTTIKPLPDMCSGETKLISVGYSPNSTILVEPMGFTQTAKQGFDSTMFIPDGPLGANCTPPLALTYSTPVTFNSFPPNASIQSATDILSICVNIEHTYAGDLGFRIICPNNQSVWIDPNQHSGGNDLGISNNTVGNVCNPSTNPPGIGWNYCWSEFYPNNGTLGSKKGTGPSPIDSTNTIAHTNYFLPGNPLSGLVGCPLNGTWSIEITDNWGADNGYIFNWDMELTANLMPNNWTYDVKIDSVGFAGPFIDAINDTTALVAPPSGGDFTYNIALVDEFGCAWDTITKMKVVQTPHPNLGSDTALCYPYTTILDPGNAGSTYSWITPSGIKTTQTIITDPINSPNPTLTNYILAATSYNTTHTLSCTGRDTISVMVSPTPLITFSTVPSDPYIVGCEPLSVSFFNTTAPSNSTYLWDFGDGQTTTDENPTHSFAAGSYKVKLTATSINGGCSQTISTFPNFIESFPQPIADFTWNPPIATRQDPTFNFTNLTTPINSSFTWEWSFYGPMPDSILLGNSTLQNPTYKFEGDYKEEKEYLVTLIAMSDHGNNVKCADTNSYNVKIIDDLLVFPNILTPNGDGVNDKFEIGALIKGGGYTEMQVIIYNRWGKKVYENINYKNDFGGDGLPDGVYYVTIKAKGLLKDVEYKSSLQILR